MPNQNISLLQRFGGFRHGSKPNVPLLRRGAASDYLLKTWGIHRAPATLAKLACTSSLGPRFYKAGRWPMYATADLDAWARKLLGEPRTSTSEPV
jgi:hypothetical protein